MVTVNAILENISQTVSYTATAILLTISRKSHIVDLL